MTKLEQQIENLKNQLTYMNLSEHPNYDAMDKLEAELRKLKSQPRSGWVVSIDNTHYLTNHEFLCLCDEPTYFETETEANEYLKNAHLDKQNHEINIFYKKEN